MAEREEITVAFFGGTIVVGKRAGDTLLRPRWYAQSEEQLKDEKTGKFICDKNGEPVTQVRMHLSPLPGIPPSVPVPSGTPMYSVVRTENNAAFYDLYQRVTQGQ